MLKKVCLLLRFHPKAATICNKHCPSVAHIRSYNMFLAEITKCLHYLLEYTNNLKVENFDFDHESSLFTDTTQRFFM